MTVSLLADTFTRSSDPQRRGRHTGLRHVIVQGFEMEKGDDDRPFIVLTETKFSFRCIPVGIGTLLTGLGSTKKTHVIVFSP